MSEMVERVARAIYAQYASDRGTSFPSWEDQSHKARDRWKAEARAAMEAIKDPTPMMVEVGRWPAEDDGPVACWQAMIDAALKGDSP